MEVFYINIISISREFGSGGRELGKRLADILGYDYYDREIIEAISNKNGLDKSYLEEILENHGWQDIPLTYGQTFLGDTILYTPKTDILLDQTQVLEEIAKAGKNCVIIGRNADAILKKYNPLKIFVYAETESKIKRCIERAEPDEDISPRKIKKKLRKIDRNRAITREMISGEKLGKRSSYHILVNTTNWQIKDLAPSIAQFAIGWFEISEKKI